MLKLSLAGRFNTTKSSLTTCVTCYTFLVIIALYSSTCPDYSVQCHEPSVESIAECFRTTTTTMTTTKRFLSTWKRLRQRFHKEGAVKKLFRLVLRP